MNTPSRRGYVMSAGDAWKRRNLMFARQRTGDLPLEKEPPITSWSESIAAGAGIIVFMLLAFWCVSYAAPDLDAFSAWLGL